MRIQHNIMAMSAYRNYTNNVSAMKKNLEKLSSGYKINRAGDDAAGLAISEKMRAQITGLETAQKNAKDGISLVQTAEGALTEVHDMLNRMVELATMSANGTYDSNTDRAQLQKEMDQLRSEIDRIADSANFNGIQLLNGHLAGSEAVEATVETGEMTNVDIDTVADGNMVTKTTTKGSYSIDLSSFTGVVSGATNAVATVAIKIGTVTIAEAANTGGEAIKASDFKLSAAVSAAGTAGVTIAANGAKYEFKISGDKITFTMVDDPTSDTQCAEDMTVTVTGAKDSTPGGQQGNQAHPLSVKIETPAVYAGERVYAHGSFDLADAFASGIKDGSALKIGDSTYVFAVGKDSKFKGGANVIDMTHTTEEKLETTSGDEFKEAARKLTVAAAGNKQFKVTNDNSTTTIDLVEKEGGFTNYDVFNLGGASATDKTDGVWEGLVDGATVSLVQVGTATNVEGQEAVGGLTLQIGDTADPWNQLKVSIGDTHCTSLGIDSSKISIETQTDAAAAVDVIKDAINKVSDIRGTLGATQNRLDHTINNLSVMTENIQDAESTIRDTDVAEEMMAYTKNNILIQSAQAMLAQANQVPQGVLQLLQ